MAEEKQFHEYPKSMHHHASGEHIVVKSEAEELALGPEYINGHEYWRGIAEGSAAAPEAAGEAVPSEHAAAEKPAKPTKKAPKPKTKKQPKNAAEPVEGQQ